MPKKRKTEEILLEKDNGKIDEKGGEINFIQFLNELRDKMKKRGLTQEILDDILKDES